MPWRPTNDIGGAIHSGTLREMFLSANDLPTKGALQMEGTDFTDDIAFVLYTSGLGLDRWEAGLFTGGTRFQIRKVVGGTPETPIVDIPSTLTGTNWKLRAELGDVGWAFFVNDEDTDLHTEPIGNFDAFTSFTGFGYVSEVDEATVSSFRIFSTTPVFDVAAEALAVVAAGNLYISLDGETMQLVAENAFRNIGQVSLSVYLQKLYGVDGENAKIYDPATETLSDWAATSGILPGASEDPDNPGTFLPGTSRARVIQVHRSRLWLAGDEQDPQNLFACAIGDPLDWDTADPVAGGAFALSASRSGRVGEPIVALLPVTNNVLLIGCTNSTWQFIGDPAFGAVDVSPLMDKHGPSGLNAMSLLSEGQALMHTQDGVYLVPAGATPINLSRQTVERDLNLDPSLGYTPHVGYDPERQQVMIWLPRDTDQTAEVHWCYDIRIGAFAVGAGGFFPDKYDASRTPTASARYGGELIFGCRDGRLRKWGDDARDDDGLAFSSKVMLLVPPMMGYETIVESWDLLAGDRDANMGVKVQASQTIEELMTGDGTIRTLQNKAIVARPTRSMKKSRGPVIAFELFAETSAPPWELERLQATWSQGSMIRRRSRGADLVTALPPLDPPQDQNDDTGDAGPGAYE